MSNAEDQANELEALASIYGDAYKQEDEGPNSFSLLLEPELDGGSKNHVAVRLHAKFPLSYPEVAPEARLSVERGLSIEQLELLRKELSSAIEENAGASMMYAVAEKLREWLQAHNEPAGSGSAYEEMMKRQKAKEKGDKGPSGPTAYSKENDPSISKRVVVSASEEDEALRRKRDGTPVTAETFGAWVVKFNAEMEERRRQEEDKGIVSTTTFYGPRPIKGRLTGRQMFEADASLAFSDMAALEESDRAAAAGAGGAGGSAAGIGAGGPIDESLFAGDDLEGLDLDDEELDDDEDEEDDGDYVPSGGDEDDDEDDGEDDEEYAPPPANTGANTGGGGGGGGKGKAAPSQSVKGAAAAGVPRGGKGGKR